MIDIPGGFPTVVIYINFSKAFDVMQHDKLFVKLQAIGIGGKILEWIENLFNERTFQTKVNDFSFGHL